MYKQKTQLVELHTLTFDAAGTDVWATGSVIESRGSSEVTFDTSAANETLISFHTSKRSNK